MHFAMTKSSSCWACIQIVIKFIVFIVNIIITHEYFGPLTSLAMGLLVYMYWNYKTLDHVSTYGNNTFSCVKYSALHLTAGQLAIQIQLIHQQSASI